MKICRWLAGQHGADPPGPACCSDRAPPPSPSAPSPSLCSAAHSPTEVQHGAALASGLKGESGCWLEQGKRGRSGRGWDRCAHGRQMGQQIQRALHPNGQCSASRGPAEAHPLGNPRQRQSGQGWGETGEGLEGTWEAGGQLLSPAKIKERTQSMPVCFREYTWPAATPWLRPLGTYWQNKSRERGELAGILVDPLLQLQNGPCLECGMP